MATQQVLYTFTGEELKALVLESVRSGVLEAIECIKSSKETHLITSEKTKWVDINGAAIITSKTPNALRVQVSLGNLKAVKKQSRLYFEREYLERWIAGETSEEKGAAA